MGPFDYLRGEPVTVENTQEELTLLSQAAQAAEIKGNRNLAEGLHKDIDKELDTLSKLKRGR
ncbi:hypothetical protein ACWGDX_13240 [Streptomyces sp. NPDC055025]